MNRYAVAAVLSGAFFGLTGLFTRTLTGRGTEHDGHSFHPLLRGRALLLLYRPRRYPPAQNA